MKKLLSIILLLFIAVIVNAQKDKPQWLMPLYFEDGKGDKDTIYIGYDPKASSRVGDIDTSLGEQWVKIDTTQFNVYVWQYPHYAPTSILTTDTVRKSTIISGFIYSPISFINGKMPITLKWDDSLLNSLDLPFPDISPRPKARIDLYCDSNEPGYVTCPIEHEPLTLTDYLASGIMFPVTDSLYFYGSGNEIYTPRYAIQNLHIEVVPHNHVIEGIENVNEESNYEIFPNPFETSFMILNPNLDNLNIEIVNSIGILVYHTRSSSEHINLNIAYLSKGVYFLIIHTRNKSFFKKLMKM